MQSLDQASTGARSVSDALIKQRQLGIENARADKESAARLGLIGEQTRAAKTDADKSAMDYNKTFQEEALKKSLGGAMEARDAAQSGTETPNGHAVDFQAVKGANRGAEQADAKLWNFLNPDKPMGSETLKSNRQMAQEGEELAASEKAADATRKQEKHESDLKTAETARESGRYTFVPGEGGRILKGNTKTGALEDTGEKGAPKPGAKSEADLAFDALPKEKQEQVKILSQQMAKRENAINELSSSLEEFKNAKTEDDKIRAGQGMLKTLNSPENPDAVGKEESERIGGALIFQKGNILNPGKFIGRDLAGFETQVQAKIDGMKASKLKNSSAIDALYGRAQANPGAGAAPAIGATKKNSHGDAIRWTGKGWELAQ